MNASTRTELSAIVRTPLVGRFAERFGMDPDGVVDILKSTAFKVRDGQATDAQMTALMIVADQYKLNPFTKEIYAYPDKQNGIVPVVGVDGWSRIINEHPQLDGIEFNYGPATLTHKGKTCHEWIECVIYRKDRAKPIVIREFFSEVVRNANFATPWDTHPNRMHRHKVLIQGARVAFGFAGIYDDDEAVRILEASGAIDAATGEIIPPRKSQGRDHSPTIKHMGAAEVVQPTPAPTAAPVQDTRPAFPDEDFQRGLPVWQKAVNKGLAAGEVLKRAEAANPSQQFTEPQKAAILSLKKVEAISFAAVADAIQKAQSRDALDLAADLIKSVADEQQRKELSAMYGERAHQLPVEG